MQTLYCPPHDAIDTVYGVLLNDADALARLTPAFATAPYKAAPKAPILYIKPRNTHAGDGTAVAVPASPGVVRIDATVGAVMGRTATRVAAAQALQYVAGYVLVSDVTLPHDDYYRPAIAERCRDGFCPIGTFRTAEAAQQNGFDPACTEISIAINGVEVHRRSLARLVRTLPQLLADVSEFMTLSPRDILLLGAPDAAPLARSGDTVAISADGLPTLHHTLVTEALP